MKLVSVAAISFYENDLRQVVVTVPDGASWKDAFSVALKHNLFPGEPDEDRNQWILSLSNVLWEARKELADGEMDISVVEITDSQIRNLRKGA